MDIEADIATKAETLRAALQAKLSVKGRSFAISAQRARRLLPRRLRRHADVIVKAQGLGGHPKLMRMVDMPAVDTAFSELETYLAKIDPADRKRTWWLKLAGVNVMNLLVVVAGFALWLTLSGGN